MIYRFALLAFIQQEDIPAISWLTQGKRVESTTPFLVAWSAKNGTTISRGSGCARCNAGSWPVLGWDLRLFPPVRLLPGTGVLGIDCSNLVCSRDYTNSIHAVNLITRPSCQFMAVRAIAVAVHVFDLETARILIFE
jgi:hypothetical protein